MNKPFRYNGSEESKQAIFNEINKILDTEYAQYIKFTVEIGADIPVNIDYAVKKYALIEEEEKIKDETDNM